jgi:XisI protein
MAHLTQTELIAITRRVVDTYDGTSPHATIHVIQDDTRHKYVVTGIENTPTAEHSWIIIQVQVEGDYVVIAEDSIWDKPLWQRLQQASIPRAQIILAYDGEKVPVGSEVG